MTSPSTLEKGAKSEEIKINFKCLLFNCLEMSLELNLHEYLKSLTKSSKLTFVRRNEKNTSSLEEIYKVKKN